MTKDTDANIHDRLGRMKEKGSLEADAILLLAQKVGQAKSALKPVPRAPLYRLRKSPLTQKISWPEVGSTSG